jgi:hypothetical protein
MVRLTPEEVDRAQRFRGGQPNKLKRVIHFSIYFAILAILLHVVAKYAAP